MNETILKTIEWRPSRVGWWKWAGEGMLLPALLLGTCTMVLYGYRLAAVPNGFYADEVSVAVNARSIADTERDEHGTSWPLYFKAFGEYKNPVYVYTAAILIKVMGASEGVVRSTGILFAAASVATLALLLFEVFRKRSVAVLGTLPFIFMPWHFDTARVAFEVGSSTFFLMAGSLFLFRWYRRKCLSDILIGTILLGLLLYTYSAMRLYSPAVLGIFFVCTARDLWQHRKHALATLACYALVVTPFLTFLIAHPDIQDRFEMLSIVGQTNWMETFVQTWAQYFSPDFLLLHGDMNPRHHAVPEAGELFYVHAVLIMAAIVGLAWGKRWKALVIFGYLTTIYPIPGALTGDTHALRGIMGLSLSGVLSSVGLAFLIRHRKLAFAAAPPLLLLMAWQAIPYAHEYFTAFPMKAAYGEAAFNREERDISDIINTHGSRYNLVYVTEAGRRVPNISPTFYDWYVDPSIRPKIISPLLTPGLKIAKGMKILAIVTPEESGNLGVLDDPETFTLIDNVTDGAHVLFLAYAFTAS